MDFVLSPSQHTARLIQSDPICIWRVWGGGGCISPQPHCCSPYQIPAHIRAAASLTPSPGVHTPAPVNFHTLIHNPSQTPDRHVYVLPAACGGPLQHRQATNTHTYMQVHTRTHNQTLSSGNNDETWWQCQAAEKGSQMYWSAICGTNSFATHPPCLTDSQIPGMPWRPVGRRLPAPLSLFWEMCNSQRCDRARVEQTAKIPLTERWQGEGPAVALWLNLPQSQLTVTFDDFLPLQLIHRVTLHNWLCFRKVRYLLYDWATLIGLFKPGTNSVSGNQ